MIVSAIVATARHNVIGKDNQTPWHLSADLSYFKKVTMGHHLIMGRNCFESIGRPLPKRTNIVVTRNPLFAANGVLVAHTVEEALGLAFDGGEDEVFVIGGGEIYRETADLWDRIYLTEIDLETDGDVYFPKISPTEWREIWSETHSPNAQNPWPYTFKVLERITAPDY